MSYGMLMGADEVGTHARFSSDVDNVMTPLFERYHGHIVKKTGDGVLAIFPSVVDAVDCAGRLQGCHSESVDGTTRRPDLVYRIGINLGDILVEDGDIYGNDVNVAVRLESISPPGGVAISGAAYWNIKGRTRVQFEEVGFLRLKNIAEPIQVYQAIGPGSVQQANGRDEGLAAGRAAPRPAKKKHPSKQRVWSENHRHQPEIVVLPFDNLSSDPAQEYFCDGLTNDLTTDLSRFSSLFVIAANTAFSYKGQHPTHERVRSELGVEYMVEGSVQRVSNQLRINVQLIETNAGHHLWAERYSGANDDLFVVQDDVCRKIVMALISKLSDAELARAVAKEIGNINAYDAFLKGLHEMTAFLSTSETRPTLQRARQWFERAMELDPEYGRPYGWLAYNWVLHWQHGWSTKNPLARAEELARKAVALDPNDHDTHWALASCYSNLGKFDPALDQYARALEINGNDANLHAEMADLLCYVGKHAEAIGQIRFAMRINPHFPEWYRWTLGWCYYFIGEYEEAVAELGKLINVSDDVLLILAASHARLADLGRDSETHGRQAHDYIARFRKRRPRWTLENQRDVTRHRKEADAANWLEGLRLAGL
ncbi:MAG TPA: adenylate/guanylate cyclase domain-containing protein [Dongiaceae bacterium]|nr:adenylate/guanylate cyclase domain-containing protein [Dongiaceae bacterium]